MNEWNDIHYSGEWWYVHTSWSMHMDLKEKKGFFNSTNRRWALLTPKHFSSIFLIKSAKTYNFRTQARYQHQSKNLQFQNTSKIWTSDFLYGAIIGHHREMNWCPSVISHVLRPDLQKQVYTLLSSVRMERGMSQSKLAEFWLPCTWYMKSR